MAKRKGRKDSAVVERTIVKVSDFKTASVPYLPPKDTVIKLPHNTTIAARKLNFEKMYGIGCDDIAYRMQQKTQQLVDEHERTRGASLSLATILNYQRAGKVFTGFCQSVSQSIGRELVFSDIDAVLIKRYLSYLSELGFGRTYFTATKQILTRCGTDNSIFPVNPYPNSGRKEKGQPRLSKKERAQVAKAVKKEWKSIQQSSGTLNIRQLISCFIGIALRTGMNPTSILELSADCLLPHPLKDDRMVIVSYKRRGNKTNITSVRKRFDHATFDTALPDVIEIVKLIIKRNADIRSKSKNPNRLFVAIRIQTKGDLKSGDPVTLIHNHLGQKKTGIPAFVKQNNLCDDFGKPLKLNTMRLRKTFENRIWELSGGDPFVTARAGNHSVNVSDTHYLEAPEDSNERLQIIVEERVSDMLSNDTEETPIAHCKDPLNGHRAPKNGKYCDAFLACFRCKSCVVTGEDLHKLFSLYWMLLRERDTMSSRAWSRHFRHILRVIDDNIAPQFPALKIKSAREHAKYHPHPYWKTLEQLGGLKNVY